MLKEPAIREVVADQIIDALQNQDATARVIIAGRPVLEPIVEQVVASDAFQGIYHASVRQLHSAVVEGARSRMLVRVDDSVQLVRDALLLVDSGLAAAIPDEALTVVVGVSQSRRPPAQLPVRA